jgi:UDP-glucose 4-epimerase
MRILITGGFGYLGGRLAQFLASRGDNEIVLGSRQAHGVPSWLPQAQVLRTQWDRQDELERICTDIEAIVHLAGMNAQACASDPVAALEFNAVATTRLVQAATRQGIRRFIYLSTAHVYGRPLIGTITERTCAAPLHPYATSHRAGEDAVRCAHERGDVDGIVIRLSNAYGAPAHEATDSWMLLVNDLCRQAVSTRRMVLRSSGLERRDFVPLTDVCRAVEHLLRLPAKAKSRSVFNVGGEWSPTVWEMAGIVQDCCTTSLGFRPELSRATPRDGEFVTDLDYRIDALRETGFQPLGEKLDEIQRLLGFCNRVFH